jgi:restriction endonuclease S subunit
VVETVIAHLSDVSEIRMGYSFRGRIEPHPEGELCVIQMKDIDQSNVLRFETAAHVLFPGDVRQHFVHNGDLIFRSRGQSYSAALVGREPITTVVASPMMLIRPRRELVDSAYLRWFLNEPSTHKTLESLAAGTAVKMISKADLQRLEVPLPSLETQSKIVEIASLLEQETKLMAEMTRLRHDLIEKTLMREARQES